MEGSTLDDDFSSYVDVRRTALVRALALVGCSPTEAEGQVQTALLRCYRSWSRVRAAADPDAHVYKVLFNSWKDSRARRWWGEQSTLALAEPSVRCGDLADDTSTGLAVRAALARMFPGRVASVPTTRTMAPGTRRRTDPTEPAAQASDQ